ncbi:unnamed protein product [Diatraea saccharalis]|uniref:Uncharacterized protein n=1 Tax=Diatraea saccharalis TaxID=40085 RepID=A0A9N9R653_9NEOP|nr:unnamed protein product [Diatraea saccharalis]
MGVSESGTEDCGAVICDILKSKMGLKDVNKSTLTLCHKLGATNGNEHNKHRPVLVKFERYELRTAVWRAKTLLKGTSISVKEFLTKPRQIIFNKARLYFGVRCCWTQEGVIQIKTSDGKRHRMVGKEDLDCLVDIYPRRSTPAGEGSGTAKYKNK